ncbi:MipA/OmpV family protein [Lysobacter sp. K5869]|uniref:MipA/OmpV family protein n=1 Tax=Lysobacter sp. K5869 TaxID=2820808 RepID=UPI001C063465|nr:MipA/OmpV family protein [Lysobacter sp. K5869]QWP75272.1 MipA/OmpV family protein [Lysobacter sp. K5869]
MGNTRTARWIHRPTAVVIFGLALAASPLLAGAQESDDSQSDDSTWAIGLGATLIQRPYRDIDDELKAVPLISYESSRWSLAGSRFDFKVNRSEELSFRLRARYALDGYDANDSPFLRGMHDRDDSAWVGGAVAWRLPWVDLSAEYLADAMGNSKGSRALLQAQHRFAFGRFGLTPRLGAEWVDKKYVTYYYGVLPEEVTPSRAAYEGKATVNFETGVRADYTIGRKHTVFLDVGMIKFGDSIKDSPLVDGSDQVRTSIGYAYRF